MKTNPLIIFICCLFLGCAGTGSLHAQDNATYIGVWRSGTTPQIIYPRTTRFSDVERRAHARGYSKLADMEIIVKGMTENTWTVWEKPTGSRDWHTTTVGHWWQFLGDFKDITGRKKSSRQLQDMEAYYNPVNQKVFHFSIYGSGKPVKQELAGASTWNGLVQLWKSRSAKGMRLISLEHFVENGTHKYAALFREGTEGYYLYNLVGWDNFVRKWEELGKKNYRLVDIETYVSNTGKRHYIGVWLYGRDGYYLWHVKGYDNFLKKFNELKGKMELVDLEVIY